MRIIRIIDRGGFGRVEEVELANGVIVARKVFDPSPDILRACPLEKLKGRFKREIRVQSALPHDFFIPILNFNLQGEDLWYSMPLCERNYQTQIAEDRTNNVSPKESFADILNALEELHSCGFVHRDLNPRNILFHEGKWKLSDFGLVSPPGDETTTLTSTLAAWGTQFYCAPEQLQDFKGVNHLADIYALGCILHDFFAGTTRVPYSQHTTEGPIGLLIEKCTDVRPERRPKNISAVRAALFTLLAEPMDFPPSIESSEWATNLENVGDWTVLQLHDFAKFITTSATTEDLWNVFISLDEEILQALIDVDLGYAETIAIEYCEWIVRSVFDFAFCDVLVHRLLFIFRLDSLDCKAKSILAIAHLGKTHHRWYVMRQLMKICDSNLDINVAKRMAIEIQVSDAYWDFIDSGTGIQLKIDNFHPIITSALRERP